MGLGLRKSLALAPLLATVALALPAPAQQPAPGPIDRFAAAAPTLAVLIRRIANDGWEFGLSVTRLDLVAARADGKHVEGQGHGRIALDGKEPVPLGSANYVLEALPPGMHAIEIGLFAHDGRAYARDGKPIAERVVFRATQPGRGAAPGTVARRAELRLEGGKRVSGPETLRFARGDLVALSWSSDAPLDLHLHGYDIAAKVAPGAPVTMLFDAEATGRFQVTSRGERGETTLLVVQVLPK